MSTSRSMPGGWVDRDSLPKGENGRNLCRWCQLEVPKGRITFCSDWCVEEWRLRSDPGYLRAKVLQRDHGVCAYCGVDCVAEWIHIDIHAMGPQGPHVGGGVEAGRLGDLRPEVADINPAAPASRRGPEPADLAGELRAAA